jgi:hypothetical protein
MLADDAIVCIKKPVDFTVRATNLNLNRNCLGFAAQFGHNPGGDSRNTTNGPFSLSRILWYSPSSYGSQFLTP